MFALLAMAGCSSPDAAAQTEPSAAESRPAEPIPSEAATPLTSLSDLAPNDVSGALRRTPGRVVLVNLWSTWCEPCMEEMPMLIEVAERFRSRELGAAFVSMDMPTNRAAALAFMVDKGARAPSYIRTGRDGDFIEAIHPEWSGTLPATILFDAERNPIRTWVGEVQRAELESAINAALSERK